MQDHIAQKISYQKSWRTKSMELKWLEDFVLLAQVKNFSKAADLRNVTQPAFSRRIKSLEIWAGTPLIDRTCFPMELTPAGLYFFEQAIALIENISETRTTLLSAASNEGLTINFAVPHNLSLTFFPEWLKEASKLLRGASYRLKASNAHDAVMTLVNGSSDLLVTYSHPCSPLMIDAAQYPSKLLGIEHFSLYGLKSMHEGLQDAPNIQIHYLSYGAGAYLGKIADHVLVKSGAVINFKKIYETDMAEGLKSMVLAGHGCAFLPESSIKKELREGSVVKMSPEAGCTLETNLEIRLFRDSVVFSKPGKRGERNLNTMQSIKQKAIDNLWNHS
jgi:DNA-binding transcriptional LysR family regulator